MTNMIRQSFGDTERPTAPHAYFSQPHGEVPPPSMLLPVIAEQLRLDATHHLRLNGGYGQIFTPRAVAQLMADLLENSHDVVRLLDAGAGTGMLFVLGVNHLLSHPPLPKTITVTAFEIDPAVARYSRQALIACEQACANAGVSFVGSLIEQDFIEAALALTGNDLFGVPLHELFTHAMLNPPYHKIHTRSRERHLLRVAGIEATNLYTGFLEVAMRLLAPDGQLIAITPRSFCNGAYFGNFRQALLEMMSLRSLHLFGSRLAVFSDELTGKETLQESVIMSAMRRNPNDIRTLQEPPIRIAASEGPNDLPLMREATYHEVINPEDPRHFIHIIPTGTDTQAASIIKEMPCSLDDLDMSVSTGRVVDFRARAFLRQVAQPGDAPLLHPLNLAGGVITWPNTRGKKANALSINPKTQSLLVPNDTYVLVKRFTSKEERRRIVAALYEKRMAPGDWIGLENHLNYFHRNGQGIDAKLATGLTTYLNSTLVDTYFRQFSGHTQVNATDLRSLRYPTYKQLIQLGERIGKKRFSQVQLDALMRGVLFIMADDTSNDPVAIKQRLDESMAVLKALGFPRAQQNERSALTLLALLNLKPTDPWRQAEAPLRGITPLMEFFAQHYSKTYAPNSRETIRRQTVHQFLDAGLIHINPDDSSRPTNSGQTVYQIDEYALKLFHAFGDEQWETALEEYRVLVPSLKVRYEQERLMARIPLRLAKGKTITISPGGQNVLIERIIHDFAERFTPDGSLVYIGDAGQKFAYFDEELLSTLGVLVNPHGKMPDVIIHNNNQNTIFLIEAVTSHGPITSQRKSDLERLFGTGSHTLIFVTVFMTRRAFAKYVDDIAWETYVWLADAPSHVVHFNGEHIPPL